MPRDTTKSHQPRSLGLAPGKFGNADVSVRNPPTFNPSKRKATGAKGDAALHVKVGQQRTAKIEKRERAKPTYNPSKQRATGSPTLNSEIRQRKANLRKKIIHEKVVRRSKQA
jgi:hypothetical protein